MNILLSLKKHSSLTCTEPSWDFFQAQCIRIHNTLCSIAHHTLLALIFTWYFVFCVSYLRFFSSLSTQFAPHFLHCFFAPIQTRFERWITRTCTNLSKTKVNFSNPIFLYTKNHVKSQNIKNSKIHPEFFIDWKWTWDFGNAWFANLTNISNGCNGFESI